MKSVVFLCELFLFDMEMFYVTQLRMFRPQYPASNGCVSDWVQTCTLLMFIILFIICINQVA